MSDTDKIDDKKTRRNERLPRDTAPINPEPKNEKLFRFLVELFELGFPEKIVLVATYGRLGQRLGPSVREIHIPPKADKPKTEELIIMSNSLLQLAQEDCDVLNRATNYVVLAYDLVRSDKAYSRVLMSLRPSGTSQVLMDERGGNFEDEEGALSTKLMLSLLDSERRDKRWMMEQLSNLFSGSAERDAARIERLEQNSDNVFERSVKYIAATEQMLSQAEDRKRLAEAAKFKQELLEKGFAFLTSFGPAVQIYLSSGKVGIVEGLEQFIQSLGTEMEETLMGKWGTDGSCEKIGILDVEQVKFIIGIIKREIDPRRLPEMAASLRPEQMVAAQQLLGQQKLTALGAIIKAANDVAEREAQKATNGASA